MLSNLLQNSLGHSDRNILALVLVLTCSWAHANDVDPMQSLDNAKQALSEQDYKRLWAELDAVTQWLEKTSPRSGLSWPQAQELIKEWVKKNWRKDATEITALSDGGMESTTERHQGSFYGYVWDTGEKTVTTDFVFVAEFKALDSKKNLRTHKVRFHFDKGPSGWYIKRGGVM